MFVRGFVFSSVRVYLRVCVRERETERDLRIKTSATADSGPISMP